MKPESLTCGFDAHCAIDHVLDLQFSLQLLCLGCMANVVDVDLRFVPALPVRGSFNSLQ